MLKSGFLIFSSQENGSSLVSFWIIFEALQSEQFRFNFHGLMNYFSSMMDVSTWTVKDQKLWLLSSRPNNFHLSTSSVTKSVLQLLKLSKLSNKGMFHSNVYPLYNKQDQITQALEYYSSVMIFIIEYDNILWFYLKFMGGTAYATGNKSHNDPELVRIRGGQRGSPMRFNPGSTGLGPSQFRRFNSGYYG